MATFDASNLPDFGNISNSPNTPLTDVQYVQNEFEKQGILVEITGGKRGRMYAFERYLSIFLK